MLMLGPGRGGERCTVDASKGKDIMIPIWSLRMVVVGEVREADTVLGLFVRKKSIVEVLVPLFQVNALAGYSAIW